MQPSLPKSVIPTKPCPAGRAEGSRMNRFEIPRLASLARDDTVLRHGKTVHKRQGHHQKNNDGAEKKSKHAITPMGDIPSAPEGRGDEQAGEVGAKDIDIQSRDRTNVWIKCDPLCHRLRFGDQKIIDPGHMKGD